MQKPIVALVVALMFMSSIPSGQAAAEQSYPTCGFGQKDGKCKCPKSGRLILARN